MWYYRVYLFAVERETTALFQNFVIERADPDGSPRRDPNLDEPRFASRARVFDISYPFGALTQYGCLLLPRTPFLHPRRVRRKI